MAVLAAVLALVAIIIMSIIILIAVWRKVRGVEYFLEKPQVLKVPTFIISCGACVPETSL